MTGRLFKFVVLAAVLALVVTAFAAQSPDIMKERAKQKALQNPQPRRGGPVENRFNLPVADGRRELQELRSSSRSVSILDDTYHKPRTSLAASSPAASPGLAICAAGTSYDYQHNDLGMKQIATLGGDEDNSNIHFVWTHWDVIPESIERVDRFFNYQGYNEAFGFCLQDCGVTVSTGDPLLARAGFGNLDLTSADNATLFFHQMNEVQQIGDQIYSSWVLDQGIPCFNLFSENELAQSLDHEIIWPHGRVDRNGDPATDVFHVVSHPTGDQGMGDEHVYWRRVGVAGAWSGPCVLVDGCGPLNYWVAVDPTSEKVAVIYNQDGLDPENLLQVVYIESQNNGLDWMNAGDGIYPDPIVPDSFPQILVTTEYGDPDGAQAWNECGGEYDFEGNLHVFWVEQAFTNVTGDARLRHWSNEPGVGFSTVAQAIGWANQGGDGARDIVLAFPGIGFGDGQTQCTDGPDNPGVSGPKSNLDYIYYVWEQYGGEELVQQADVSFHNQQNLEVYMAVSNDGGKTWSPPMNMTDTRTPGCDGTPGKECGSERDPFIAYTINDAIHILYIHDIAAGDAVFSDGPWTYNPVMYLKIDPDNQPKSVDPDTICPVIAPSFQARITNATPDCEFHATYQPPGVVSEQLLIENFGNAQMIGEISVHPPPDWLTVAGGPYTCAAGDTIQRSVQMNAGAPSIQHPDSGEGLYQATITITHNDPSRPTPQTRPVDFFVFNDFACPEYATLHTGVKPGVKGLQSTGELWLEVSNVERITRQNDDDAGLARLCSDSSWSIYDGSLIIGVPPDPDTLVYRNIFGSGNGQPGFRALSGLIVDTSKYGPPGQGEAWAFANQTTVDSLIGIDVIYRFPQNADSSEFVLIGYGMYNRTDQPIADLAIGFAADLDVNPRPDSADDLQSGAQNAGYAVQNYNMLYQQGVDSTGHVVVGDHSAQRFKCGLTAIQCDSAPRAWIAPNDPYIFGRPGGGWHEGYLYDEMTKTGYDIYENEPDPGEDLHSVVIFDQGVNLPGGGSRDGVPIDDSIRVDDYKYLYVLGLVSSNTGLTDADLLASTAKAWKYAFGWWVFTELDSVPPLTPKSYQYIAVGSHEGGLGSGCCGCIVTKVSGDPELTVGGGEPGDCMGTIEFAGGSENPCDYPYTATFQVTDLCGARYSELATIAIESTEECTCDCPYQSDFDEDGFFTALDLGAMIDILFAGAQDVQDPGCPTTRADFDCDGFSTALDLGGIIDLLFAGGPEPCDPCDVEWP